jgi:hypothetical protein
VLLYGSEVWGTSTVNKINKEERFLFNLSKNMKQENVHIKFCKFSLGVGKRTTPVYYFCHHKSQISIQNYIFVLICCKLKIYHKDVCILIYVQNIWECRDHMVVRYTSSLSISTYHQYYYKIDRVTNFVTKVLECLTEVLEFKQTSWQSPRMLNRGGLCHNICLNSNTSVNHSRISPQSLLKL